MEQSTVQESGWETRRGGPAVGGCDARKKKETGAWGRSVSG